MASRAPAPPALLLPPPPSLPPLQLDKRTASAALPSASTKPATAIPQSELDALEARLASLQHRKERLGRDLALLGERAATAALGRGGAPVRA